MIAALRSGLGVRAPVPATAALSLCAAAIAGWLFVSHRSLVELPAALLVGLALVSSGYARVALVVFGGLLVFQSSDELTSTKLLFFAGAALSAGVALMRAQQFTHDRGYRILTPFFVSSLWFTVLIIASLPVSLANATPQKDWLRDVAPYMLFAAAPLLAFDLQKTMGERGLRRLLIAAGLAGSLAFAAGWLSRRGILDFSSVGLATFLLGAALFAYAMAMVLEGDRHRLGWLLLASSIVVGFLATGTRSTALLLAAPAAIVLGSRRRFARRSVRLAILLPAAAVLVAIGIQSFVRASGADREILNARAQLVFQTGASADQSYLERRSQADAAWALFKQSPITGVGPGYPMTWVDSSGEEFSGTNLDTPVAYLAKFGLLGLLPLAVLAWAFARVLQRLREATGERTISQLALIGFAGIFVAWSVLQVPFEDKGLASGLLLLLALVVGEASATSAKEP